MKDVKKRLEEYRKELSTVDHKLDTNEISLAMYREEVVKLQAKHRVTDLFKEGR